MFSKALPRSFARLLVLFFLVSVLSIFASSLPTPTQALSTTIVISQVYGGGGNSGSTYRNDFIELFNRGNTTVSLAGWSVQYASAAGTTWAATNLSGSLAPGQYYLIQETQGAGGTTNLPTPDATGTIAMSATAGKVALVNSTTLLTGSCPSGATIIDFVGFGTTANCFEGAGATPAPSNTNAVLRATNGCTETDNNSTDFATGTPNPRNTASVLNVCSGGDAAPAVSSTTPTTSATNIAINSNIVVNFSEAVNVAGSWYTISCATSGTHTATVSGGPTTFTLNPDTDFANSESCTVTIIATQVTDQDTNDPPDAMTANYQWSFTTVAGATTRIRDIQGSAHISPLNGSAVSNVPGIVTAVGTTGFWMQDPSPDANDATSEGIFVYTTSAPGRAVGDSVTVSGTVTEYRPAGNVNNLTTTEITSPAVTLVSTGNALPAAIVVGTGGRIPPTTIISDDASGGNVENAGTMFDPANDGIDFWESLEGMRVQLNNARAVGPSRYYASSNSWELPVVGDNGANSTVNTIRGGVVIRSTDYNPERILLADALNPLPHDVNVGDGLGTVVGVIDYSFSNFKLYVTTTPTRTNNNLAPETTTAQTGNQFSVATLNVENLDPNDSDGDTDVASGKFAGLAAIIVTNMQSPDIIVVEEIQDNNGTTNDGTVAANTTWTTLITAITTAGGPTYQYRQIDPANNADGGATGGNIRQGFLYRTDRGLAFVDRPGATATTVNTVINNSGVPQLQYSPGRIDPNNAAFSASRKPLAGEFTFNGSTIFVIANHWNSKGGDQPLYGPTQPPTLSSEAQRIQQATVVRDFVASIRAIDSNARVLVMGDLNDFEFSTPLTTIKNSGMLSALIETLPQNERYSYTYEGNSQTLDHILATASLMAKRVRTDVVRVNSEFATRWSDHDPQIGVFDLAAPTAVTLTNFAAHTPDTRARIAIFFLLIGAGGGLAVWLGWAWRKR
jgi:predicted extracellular nuclease